MKKLVISIATLLLLFGCHKKDTIKIATKPMTEQLIIGEMLVALITEYTDYPVNVTHGIGGGTANIQPALLKGDFDLYPEYTGTAWNYVLKRSGETIFGELIHAYENQYQLKWVGMYGFNNTFGLVLRRSIADEHGITTYSELAAIAPELVFGAEYDFYEREDGFDALCETYGYEFERNIDLDIGLKYAAINKAEIDVMNIFTTDGQLAVSDVAVLEDDKLFYQTYYCGTVVREDALNKFPLLEDVLMMMDNILTEDEMARLNYEVETEKADPKAVALAYLKSKGLIK